MDFLYILGFIAVIILFLIIKKHVWDKPQEEIFKLNEELLKIKSENEQLNARLQDSIFLSEVAKSNLRAIPYMSAIMAEFETYGLEKLARKLDWGCSQERLKK